MDEAQAHILYAVEVYKYASASSFRVKPLCQNLSPERAGHVRRRDGCTRLLTVSVLCQRAM